MVVGQTITPLNSVFAGHGLGHTMTPRETTKRDCECGLGQPSSVVARYRWSHHAQFLVAPVSPTAQRSNPKSHPGCSAGHRGASRCGPPG